MQIKILFKKKDSTEKTLLFEVPCLPNVGQSINLNDKEKFLVTDIQWNFHFIGAENNGGLLITAVEK